MKRRNFIQSSALVTLPYLLRGMEVTAINRSALATLINPDSDKVLVLVQLNGGNDGLNTFIPLDQYDNLVKARANVILPSSSILKAQDTNGFNPAMSGMHRLYQDGKVNVVQGVAYPDQNRSHFRSTDIWTSASDSDEYLSTGWLGRHFSVQYPGYPADYPNEEYPDPFAITLGYIVSETCQGDQSNFSYAVANEAALTEVPVTVGGNIDNTSYGMELAYVKDVIRQSNAYTGVVKQAFDKGNNTVDYPESNLGNQLKIVANLISGGLKTKVYVVSIGGFDTHANQIVADSPLEGNHAELLTDLSSCIKAFQDDINALGVSERVVGMTFSEFGRRIKSNDAFGTDHGTAAPLFLFGDCIQGGVIGENAQISDAVEDNEGVAMQYDFRSVYATILMDWFEVEEQQVRDVLFDDFQRLPFLKDCSLPTDTDDVSLQIESACYPNPASSIINVVFESKGGDVSIELYDAIGSRLAIHTKQNYSAGRQEIAIALDRYVSGIYFIRIAEGNRLRTLRFVKQ